MSSTELLEMNFNDVSYKIENDASESVAYKMLSILFRPHFVNLWPTATKLCDKER